MNRRRLCLSFAACLIGGVMSFVSAAPVAAQVPSATAFQSDRIVVSSRGQGPDVILIPGLASTAEVWRRTADRLDDTHRVHLVSVRGFGDVPAGANAEGPLVGPVAAEVRRYVATQKLNRPALIGHSMGGLIAMSVAADSPGAVGRVMVVDATPFFPSLISPGATAGDVEPIARIAYQALRLLGDDVLRSQGRAMGVELGGASDSLFGAMGWQGGDRGTLAQGLYEVMTLDLRARLPEITAPVTVVYGSSRDAGSPRNRADTLFQTGYRTLPRPATFAPVEGAEHMVMIDQPTRFLAVVERFLD